MTTQQMELAVEVARMHSISKAAEKLFLSQSNASNMIKSLEREVGFAIFYRNNMGAFLTERGEIFLSHIQVMQEHMREIYSLKEKGMIVHFRLGNTSYTPVIQAFHQLYRENILRENLDFSCQSISFEEGLKKIWQLKLDLFVGMFSKKIEPEALREIKRYKLESSYIAGIPLNINLRENHPLTGQKEIKISDLENYPFIDYWQANLAEITNQMIQEEQVRYKYRVTVDERELRCRLVADSDAFSVGCRIPRDKRRKYGLVSYPLEGLELKMYAIFRPGEGKRPEIRRYLEILQEKLADI